MDISALPNSHRCDPSPALKGNGCTFKTGSKYHLRAVQKLTEPIGHFRKLDRGIVRAILASIAALGLTAAGLGLQAGSGFSWETSWESANFLPVGFERTAALVRPQGPVLFVLEMRVASGAARFTAIKAHLVFTDSRCAADMVGSVHY